MSYMPIVVDLNKRIQYCKKRQFTGILSIESEGPQKTPWHVYFLAGQIVWINTTVHAKRRWRRQLLLHCPELPQKFTNRDPTYSDLVTLVRRKKFSRDKFSKLVAGCIAEALFDMIQQGALDFQSSRKLLNYRANTKDAAKFPCVSLQQIQIWDQVQKEWQVWRQSQFIDILPSQSPLIINPQKLREDISLARFRALTRLIDGQGTLRDVAIRGKQPLLSLTRSIAPYIRKGYIRMVDIEDNKVASAPNKSTTSETTVNVPAPPPAAQPLPTAAPQHQSTVFYIDDSPTDSQAMATIVQKAGHGYVNIADPLQALPHLLEVKPQLIFLDLVMPIANGYEICAQIRRVSAFQKIPIIIVTNNDGIADRVRAKIVGASGFMSKPIVAQKVDKVLKKYLKDHPHNTAQSTLQLQLSPSN